LHEQFGLLNLCPICQKGEIERCYFLSGLDFIITILVEYRLYCEITETGLVEN